MGYLHTVQHSEVYHGHGKRAPFFEGWYYKLIDASEQHRIAVIPGVFIGKDNSHAFVQVLDGINGKASYHPYPLEQFRASDQAFEAHIADNTFNSACMLLNLHDDQRSVRGELRFENLTPLPHSFFAPGIMGPFSWLTFMECYHGIVSLNHTLQGTLEIDGKRVDFTGGKGYIEKDWGQAFPSAYVWMQTNHFDAPETCLSASIAMIPSLGFTFRGFIIAFWHGGKHYRFATYTGAQVEKLDITDAQVVWVVRGGGLRLEMTAARAAGGLLHAPIRTEMHRRVDETLQATVQVRLSEQGGKVIFDGLGRCAGLEVFGDLERLLKG
jgi:tocopherol cyclase